MPKTNSIPTNKFFKQELKKRTEEIKDWVGDKLTQRTEEIKDWVGDKLTQRTEEIKEQVDTVFAKYKNETMTKLDQIVGMLEKDSQERTITSYQVSEHTDQLENHAKRIKRLEKIATFSSR